MSNFLASNGNANRTFRRELKKIQDEGIECFVFGGFARAIYVFGASASPKDVDLVFDCANYEKFLSRFSSSIKKRNRFGGANLQLGSIEVDAWRLEDTWAFKQGYFDDQPSFEMLPHTTYLSADAIAVELWPKGKNARRVFSGGFFETYDHRILKVNFDPNPFPELTVIRTLVSFKENCFAMDSSLARSTRDILMQVGVDRVYDQQVRHYKRDILSLGEIRSLVRLLIEHLNVMPNSAFRYYREDHQHSFSLSDNQGSKNIGVDGEMVEHQLGLFDHEKSVDCYR